MDTTADLKVPPFKQRFPWLGGDLQTIVTASPLIDIPSSMAP